MKKSATVMALVLAALAVGCSKTEPPAAPVLVITDEGMSPVVTAPGEDPRSAAVAACEEYRAQAAKDTGISVVEADYPHTCEEDPY